jgi:hypothetical protein
MVSRECVVKLIPLDKAGNEIPQFPRIMSSWARESMPTVEDKPYGKLYGTDYTKPVNRLQRRICSASSPVLLPYSSRYFRYSGCEVEHNRG